MKWLKENWKKLIAHSVIALIILLIIGVIISPLKTVLIFLLTVLTVCLLFLFYLIISLTLIGIVKLFRWSYDYDLPPYLKAFENFVDRYFDPMLILD